MYQSVFSKGREARIRVELLEDAPDEHEFMIIKEDGNGLTTADYLTRAEMDTLCDKVLDALSQHDRARINRELK